MLKPPTENELFAAVREVRPLSPPAPWVTLAEVMEGAGLTERQARTRVAILMKQGKVEMQRAPRRTDGIGMCNYYRFKNGK